MTPHERGCSARSRESSPAVGSCAMTVQTVTVFGGTGFLGRRIVRHLDAAGFGVRVASRHPERVRSLFPEHPTMEAVGADITDENSTSAALAGAFAVVTGPLPTESMHSIRG